jgi:hypothetical protein
LIMSPIFFLLGPGFALLLGAAPLAPASICAAVRLLPGLGPFLLGPGGASDDGVLGAPFMLAAESVGVSTGVGSMICGAGVGGEGLVSCKGATGSCGNALSKSGDSLSVTTSDFDFVVMFARSEWVATAVVMT